MLKQGLFVDMPIKILLFFVVMIFMQVNSSCQQFYLQGSATLTSSTIYTITPGLPNKAGLVTNYYPLDLGSNFELNFDLNFGVNDATGADGMAFMLTNTCNPVLLTGQGLGVAGTLNSIIAEFDTYDNGSVNNDIPQDHIGIYADGSLKAAGNIMDGTTLPVCALPTCLNIEDGIWHAVKIKWQYISSVSQKLSVYFDGVLRASSTQNHINNRFKGNKIVFWTIGGATGAYDNLQQFRFSANGSITNAYCPGVAFTLTAPGLGSNYVWSNGNSSLTNIATYVATASQTINCSYINYCGRAQTISFLITVFPSPVIQVNNPIVCGTAVATISSTVSPPGSYTYYWQVPVIAVNPGNVAAFSTTTSGIYSVHAIDNNTACESNITNSLVTISPRPAPLIIFHN